MYIITKMLKEKIRKIMYTRKFRAVRWKTRDPNDRSTQIRSIIPTMPPRVIVVAIFFLVSSSTARVNT